MRACELAALLAQDAEGVAQLLLPTGRKESREWVCGDVDGSAGNSLKVVVQGSKAGWWKDFATDEGGDLVGLWMATKSVDLRTACTEICQHLGIVEAKLEPARKVYSRPSREGMHPVQEPLLTWLKSVRKLTDKSITAYKLASKKGAIMFPYLRDDELIFAKYRAAPDKRFWTDADCEPCLFGWQAVPVDARAVTLAEGELDALALYEYGFPALSVPFGGGKGDKQQWIEHEFDRLAIFDVIYLALDQDAAGEQAVQEIVTRLGRERCKVVRLPRKDANDCLMQGVAKTDIEAAFAAARTLDPPRLRDSGEFEDAVLHEFEIGRHGEIGIRLPWNKVGDRLVLRPGEVSIWAGINGHGKSEVVGHIALDAVLDDHRICCASLEFRPEKWLKRMVRQAAGTAMPTPAHIRHIMQAIRGRLWVYNATGTSKSAEMLDVFAYATKRYGVRLFVIDNLAKCGFAEDDYNGQKGFVDVLSDLAREHNVHVMIVAHTKKTDKGEDKPPEKHDIKGTGALTDMADTVVTVWRNKPKERRIAAGDASPATLKSEPDCVLVCSKQRNGEDEPRILLWFDRASHQYLEEPGLVAMPLLGQQSVGRTA
jgi:twinkle protein